MPDILPQESQEEKPGPVAKTLKFLAYPLALLVGGFYGHTSARNSAYDILKNTKEFNGPIRQAHWQEVNKVAGPVGDIRAALATENRNFYKKTSDFFRERNLRNTYDYFKVISRPQKLDAIMSFATAAAVTLGVVLFIADHKLLAKRFSEQDKNNQFPTP